jgi:hypothetical protein
MKQWQTIDSKRHQSSVLASYSQTTLATLSTRTTILYLYREVTANLGTGRQAIAALAELACAAYAFVWANCFCLVVFAHAAFIVLSVSVFTVYLIELFELVSLQSQALTNKRIERLRTTLTHASLAKTFAQ